MKIITKKKQKEVFLRLCALRKICSEMNEKINPEYGVLWGEIMEYTNGNILEIANIVGGVPMMCGIKHDAEIYWEGDK